MFCQQCCEIFLKFPAQPELENSPKIAEKMGSNDVISKDSYPLRCTRHRLEGDDLFFEGQKLPLTSKEKGHHHPDVALQLNKYGRPLPYGVIYT